MVETFCMSPLNDQNYSKKYSERTCFFHYILFSGCLKNGNLSKLILLLSVSFEGTALIRDGPNNSPTSPSPQQEEIEPRLLEFEQDPPNWKDLAPPDALKHLSKKEVKRQEVINGEKDPDQITRKRKN